MNGLQNGKNNKHEKPFQGCLGRVVNLFDMSTGVPANRLLTNKPYGDGFPLSRSHSDVSGTSPIGERIEDKVIISELRRTSSVRKSVGTPIKMLIAEEMSKEVDSKQNPPSVVAKLMGLDPLPRKQPGSASQRSNSRGYLRSHSGMSLGYWQQEHGFLDPEEQDEIHHNLEENEYKDVYEIWQSRNTNNVRDKSPRKEKCNGTTNEKKMALVREKFIEAKCLATDEKLRQSKQFQDALEVLSSNKELFLKFLQEPNSLFSQRLYDLQSCPPPPPETKRITVLRPAKMVDNTKNSGSGKKNGKQINKTLQFCQDHECNKSNPGASPPASFKLDNYTQPTQIVILKPSPGKSHGIKDVFSPLSSSPKAYHVEDSSKEPEVDGAQESREVAKEITRQMRENLRGRRRDETLLSSVFSNGYIGDESSFDKSENESDAMGNLSDSEVMSPASRHSWDYINKFGSPYSSSSFSRASYSPESSVCREAKKRLSERWAMMASNGSCQEQKHVRRSSSTLGEMLALSDKKNLVKPEAEGSNKEQESRGSTSCLASALNNKDEGDNNSPRNLLRSKSVPVSSTAYDSRLNFKVSDTKTEKTDVTKEVVANARSEKSSLKGRVSSLFLRNKKYGKEKSSQSREELESPGLPRHSPGTNVSRSECFSDTGPKAGLSPDLHGSLSRASSPDSFSMEHKQGIISAKAMCSVTNPFANENSNENQEQLSPISVLEPPFEEDYHITPELSGNDKLEENEYGEELLGRPIKSNLIDKSPPIGSIARTLSWDDSCVETASPYRSKPSVLPMGALENEQEWFFFAQTLLSAAGLDSEVPSVAFLARYHSLESPLDPSLRDRCIELNNKETQHEGKRRQRRSTQKLVFDCVNAALVELAGYGSGSETCQRAIRYSGTDDRLEDHASSIMVDCVWTRMKEWFASEIKCVWGDGGDSNSLVVERVVRKEVVGKGWAEQMRSEMDILGNEIGAKLLEELVQEAVVELTGRV